MNPQHWVSGAPFAWIASENASGWSQTRFKDSRRCLKRSYKSSNIWGKNESCITFYLINRNLWTAMKNELSLSGVTSQVIEPRLSMGVNVLYFELAVILEFSAF